MEYGKHIKSAGQEAALFGFWLLSILPAEYSSVREPSTFRLKFTLVWQYRQPEICPVGIRLE
ncbi:MAG: hypothetical protein M3209_20620 [Acidobacteriota bacterium]|nr:hypothetical protein [Acidobacteriota bacterium]